MKLTRRSLFGFLVAPVVISAARALPAPTEVTTPVPVVSPVTPEMRSKLLDFLTSQRHEALWKAQDFGTGGGGGGINREPSTFWKNWTLIADMD